MRLIINADDFGLCASVNRAIIDAYLAGNLTSATLMVAMPGTADAVRLAGEHPGLGVGLHFTLTEGRPLTDAPSLVNDRGNFVHRSEFIKRAIRGTIRKEEIAAEFREQVTRAQELGIRLTHIDSHQHLHMVPQVFKAIMPVVKEESLKLRVAVPNIEKGLAVRRPQKFAKQKLLQWNTRRLLRGRQLKHNDVMISIHDLPALPTKPEAYHHLLRPYRETNQIVELVVHPYFSGAADLDRLYPDDLKAHQPFFAKCFLEHRLLTMRPNMFADYSLVNYGAL